MEQTKLYSVEYVDDEGDSVLNHVYMTTQGALDLLEKMRIGGVACTICDLSRTSVTLADVSSLDAGQMGQAGRGLIE